MKISYKPLWHLLLDKGWSKSQLIKESKISSSSLAKMVKGENITTGVLLKICETLDCDIKDIMEIEKEVE